MTSLFVFVLLLKLSIRFALHPKSFSTSISDPPFYPATINELSQDAAYQVKVALMGKVSRIRIDTRTRILSSRMSAVEWLNAFALEMLDQEFTKIRIFMDSMYLTAFQAIPKSLSSAQIQTSILAADKQISNKDKLFIIFRPSNRNYFESESSTTCKNNLEDVQAICFHSSLKKIPVVIIDPALVSTMWNQYGNQFSPMLLGDFCKVYYICDDYHVLAKNRRVGLVHRLTSGCDAYILEDFKDRNSLRLTATERCVPQYQRCTRVLTQCDPASSSFSDDIHRLASKSVDDLEHEFTETRQSYQDYEGNDSDMNLMQMTYDV